VDVELLACEFGVMRCGRSGVKRLLPKLVTMGTSVVRFEELTGMREVWFVDMKLK
jgi:hypothetical protein